MWYWVYVLSLLSDSESAIPKRTAAGANPVEECTRALWFRITSCRISLHEFERLDKNLSSRIAAACVLTVLIVRSTIALSCEFRGIVGILWICKNLRRSSYPLLPKLPAPSAIIARGFPILQKVLINTGSNWLNEKEDRGWISIMNLSHESMMRRAQLWPFTSSSRTKRSMSHRVFGAAVLNDFAASWNACGFGIYFWQEQCNINCFKSCDPPGHTWPFACIRAAVDLKS